MGSEINQEDKKYAPLLNYGCINALFRFYQPVLNIYCVFWAIVVNHKLRRFNNRIVKSHNLFSYRIFCIIKYGQQVVIYSVRCLFLSIKGTDFILSSCGKDNRQWILSQ